MGKGKGEIFSDIRDIENMSRELQKKQRKLVVRCDHKKNGNFKLTPIGMGGKEFECSICRTRFSIDHIAPDAMVSAVSTLHNAVQQIRLFAKDGEEEIVRVLGELDYNIAELPELYHRTRNENGKGGKRKKNKNKNKNNGNNSGFGGGYGSQGLSFIGGR